MLKPKQADVGHITSHVAVHIANDSNRQIQAFSSSAKDDGIAAGVDRHVQWTDQGFAFAGRLGAWAGWPDGQHFALGKNGV